MCIRDSVMSCTPRSTGVTSRLTRGVPPKSKRRKHAWLAPPPSPRSTHQPWMSVQRLSSEDDDEFDDFAEDVKYGRKEVKNMKVRELRAALKSSLDASEMPKEWPTDRIGLAKLLRRVVHKKKTPMRVLALSPAAVRHLVARPHAHSNSSQPFLALHIMVHNLVTAAALLGPKGSPS